MAKKTSSRHEGNSSSKPITDPRFANFQTDPRFRLPSSNRTKTTLDKRFSHALRDNDFTGTSRVDKYGRRVESNTKKKALERLYREDDDEEGSGDDEEDDVRGELRAANAKFDPARGGGFSSSEEEEDEEEDELEDLQEDAALERLGADVEAGEVTRRLAVVNLDWDHVKAVDLMALFTSFLPVEGQIQKVSIYPSDFGKSRMNREEMEGPPKEIFKKAATERSEGDSEDLSDRDGNNSGDDSDEAIKKELIKEGGDEDFDSNALRSYQLDRLRYYYAVVACSDLKSAQGIYEATDGTEYLSSSNFLDLRFIPDEVTFNEDEPRDECDSVPNGYRPIDFVTEALQSSKVKLTWDMDPDESSRKESIRKAFTGSKRDIAENDLHAYLASDSEHDESPSGDEDGQEELVLTKKELARRKMRKALGLSNDSEPKRPKSDAVGDMEITFTPALMGGDSAKSKKGDLENETTVEKYMRKERERKEKKREKSKAKRDGLDNVKERQDPTEEDADEDLGFNDPFFTTDPEKPTQSAVRKEERRKKRESREVEAAENAAQRAKLELLMGGDVDDKAAHLDHFDMHDIRRAEKQKNKAKKLKKKEEKLDQSSLQQGFAMNVADSRFKAVFADHEFAIDPSDPRFKATEGMKKLLEEGRKRKHGGEEIGHDESGNRQSKRVKAAEQRPKRHNH